MPPQRHQVDRNPTGKRLAFLSLTALGIVYGDIGTSPLYALQQCFMTKTGLAPNVENVFGVLSLIVWLLVLVVAVKYIAFIMRADNRGEGGILALMALILQQERRRSDSKRRLFLITLGLFGAALLYGDGIITPAMSVLSAVEGLKVVTPALNPYTVVTLAAVILFALFAVQKFGTGRVGTAFGPIMALWFTTIAALGAAEIIHEPRILFALNPVHGVRFFILNGRIGFLALGAVVLAVTGAEALYADMGHFGKRPIRVAWFSLVLPALLINYLGQGALLLRTPTAVSNPFFLLAPRAILFPLVVLATLAAVIASQALISGAFSLTQQAVQLGYSPRVTILHTSAREAGQIYIPEISKLMMVGCLLLVVFFQSSESLGAAYGVAVTGTMAITSLLFSVVARGRWNWSLMHVIPITIVFLAIDLALFSANVIKIEYGGWVPLAIAIVVYTLLSTWKKGRILLNKALHAGALPLDLFLGDVARKKPPRVPGTAVFMTSSNDGVPVVLLHHLKHNKMLHEQVILMSVVTSEIPEIKSNDRLSVESLEHGFYRITARYGFMETPNVPEILQRARESGIKAKPNDTTFYLGRERIILATGEHRPGTRRAPDDVVVPRMWRWRKKIFVLMSRNARSATEFFGIPPNRVVELGAQVEF
ncbi:MAG TPA: potassium transporter Kup [Gemmatimonadaceae bacterium]|nr:potassium transporter Kup [Gemmatimonadaceae bacterium]